MRIHVDKIVRGIALLCTLSVVAPSGATAQLSEADLAGLELRNIGPAFMSGRVSDVAIHPTDRSVWYVTFASGNVWKTTNRGTTWTPIFDRYGSYSIGSVTLDPNNPNIVWIGTGENTSQRSVGYGDGIYKSLDGGGSFQRMGLERSEHIGKILVDPRDSDVVFAASQGPLWAPGGERGLFKSTDGGITWRAVLEISENTGVADVVFDPRNPNVLYAASFQRRRHVGILVAGGPESAVYKSVDGGESWRKVTRGLPRGDIGRIALAVSPQQPDVVYALIAAEEDKSGFFRSTDRGESWTKQSDYIVVDPQYYGEIYADPHRFDHVYAMDVFIHVTDDGGRTFERLGSEYKHVDNHALVFDPDDPEYLMVGSDGGLYESWDRGSTWKYHANLPVTQFYRVGIDNVFPFYNVYGGTQDNATQGGPSRTTTVHGIRNSDWYVTVGGDGFQARIDPDDPNVVYSMSQYAGIVRYDRRSGETIDIQPQPGPNDEPLRWHWDAPLIISPHAGQRLYFAANRLFRSDDRGDTWRPISGELSRGLDRNQVEVMGRLWGPEAVWKHVFTSPFGTVVALDESPLVEGLIYAGTDDGLVQMTEDGGQNWRRIDRFPGVPDQTYIADVLASRHDPGTVYAVFNNHKQGDFAPYILRSNDRGRTWTPLAGTLPDRHVVWSIAEDHVDPNLLFTGTEFGLFVSVDGGERWVQLRGGVPTVAFRDLEIQRRENDLVAASFGRGFFILDDYTPLRSLTGDALADRATLFPVKDAWMYVPDRPMGGGEKAVQGHAFYAAPNPPYGSMFTYYVRDGFESRYDRRRRLERDLVTRGERIVLPTWEELQEERREDTPAIILTVTDEEGNVVRRLVGPTSKGMHRVAWDHRYPGVRPVGAGGQQGGPMVVPGRYQAQLAQLVDGIITPHGDPRSFEITPLGTATLPAADKTALLAFQRRAADLQRAVMGANQVMRETARRIDLMQQAILTTPGVDPILSSRLRDVELRLVDLQSILTGDETHQGLQETTLPSILDRVQRVVRAQVRSTSATTTTHRNDYEIAADAFEPVLAALRQLVEADLREFDAMLEAAGAPWTPGRGVPRWTRSNR